MTYGDHPAFDQVIDYAKEVIEKHPDLKDEIEGYIELMTMNIEDGESVQNETDMCYLDIMNVAKEKENV